jgi:hypothetical protein
MEVFEDIYDLKEEEISSADYVLGALEGSIWCLLATDNYKKKLSRKDKKQVFKLHQFI